MSRRRPLPLITVGLVLANLGAYAFELAGGGLPVCEAYGLVPERLLRTGGLAPVLASTFLHDPTAPFTHLLGNMITLMACGLVAEPVLGRARLAALYVASGVIGALLHVAVAPESTISLVGASGAICGVMAIVAALRPHMLGFVGTFVVWNIWWAFTGTSGDVSFAAHLGGFATGASAVVIAGARGTVEVWRLRVA